MTAFFADETLLSWGRVERPRQFVAQPVFRRDVDGLVGAAADFPNGLLARGLGRSYGDSNLNAEGAVIRCEGLDRLIAFDPESGVLRAEAGVSLARIIEFALPRGFFLPVSPGTKHATLAGAIANDVHGKNHHRAGTFGRFVEEIGLLRSDLSRHRLRPSDESGLFAATVGGLGLTGVITDAAIRLKRVSGSLLDAETIPFANLAEFFALSAESEATHDYTVAWVDCLASGRNLGRGLFTRANHTQAGALEATPRKGPAVPFETPSFLLNRFSIGAMNAAYYRLGRWRAGVTQVPYDKFFYPLDGVHEWNRFYGKRGMYQYQSVVPPAAAAEATAEMLRRIAAAGEGSFLAVLKTFSSLPSPGLLSFPAEGTTLALDFSNRGASTLALMAQLDAVVSEAGGRLYPAKDGRLTRAMFERGYPALARFRAHRDPGMSSSFWRRMEAA